MKNLSQELSLHSANELKNLAKGIEKFNKSTSNANKFSGKEVWSKGATRLYEYAGEGEKVLVIPSMINKSYILDLNGNSFMQNLAKSGLKPYLLDWGIASKYEEDFSIKDYLKNIVLSALKFISNEEKVSLIGYCMGGFLSLAIARLFPDFINKITTIAMPWDFSHFNKVDQNIINHIHRNNKIVPSSIIQRLFYFSDPFSVNRKYQKFATNQFADDKFCQIENWVNDGIPMPSKVFKECFGDIAHKNLLFNNNWKIDGKIISPNGINKKILSIFFTRDAVVKRESTLPFNSFSNVKSLEMNSGHIAPIINSRYELAKTVSDWIYV